MQFWSKELRMLGLKEDHFYYFASNPYLCKQFYLRKNVFVWKNKLNFLFSFSLYIDHTSFVEEFVKWILCNFEVTFCDIVVWKREDGETGEATGVGARLGQCGTHPGQGGGVQGAVGAGEVHRRPQCSGREAAGPGGGSGKSKQSQKPGNEVMI